MPEGHEAEVVAASDGSPGRARLLQGAAVLAAVAALGLAVTGTGWVVVLSLGAIVLTVWAHGSDGYSSRLSSVMVMTVAAAVFIRFAVNWPPSYLGG